jgi:hypothetical protein
MSATNLSPRSPRRWRTAYPRNIAHTITAIPPSWMTAGDILPTLPPLLSTLQPFTSLSRFLTIRAIAHSIRPSRTFYLVSRLLTWRSATGVEFLATDGKSGSTERMWTKRVQKPRRYSRYICALLGKVGSFCRLPVLQRVHTYLWCYQIALRLIRQR